MPTFEPVPPYAQSVSVEVQSQLLEPIVAATQAALREMVGSEPIVLSIHRAPFSDRLGDIAAELPIKAGGSGCLVISFPRATAIALARRVLANVSSDIDDSLLHDCMGEIANVIGGQAKALMAESVRPLAFAMPPVVADSTEIQPIPVGEVFVIMLAGDGGEFALQLWVKNDLANPFLEPVA